MPGKPSLDHVPNASAMLFPNAAKFSCRKRALLMSTLGRAHRARELLCIIVDNILCTLHVLFEFRIIILGAGVLDVPYETHPPPLHAPLFFPHVYNSCRQFDCTFALFRFACPYKFRLIFHWHGGSLFMSACMKTLYTPSIFPNLKPR